MKKSKSERALKKILQYGESLEKRQRDLLEIRTEKFGAIFEKWAHEYGLTDDEKKTIVVECFLMARDVILYQELDKSGRLEHRQNGIISQRLDSVITLISGAVLLDKVGVQEAKTAISVLQKISDMDEALSKALMPNGKKSSYAFNAKIHDTYKVVIDIFRRHVGANNGLKKEPLYGMVAELHSALFGLDQVQNESDSLSKLKIKRLSSETIDREYQKRSAKKL